MTRTRLFAFATTLGVTAATIACPSSGGGGGNIAQPYGVPPRPEPTMVDGGQEETTAIAPPGTIDPPPPGIAPTVPNTAPTGKPPYGPGAPVAMYGAPPAPNNPTP